VTASSVDEGFVEGMPFPEYLAVEALSASSARKLLPPSCPALFRQEQLTPYTSDRMDLGKVAHAVILEGLSVDDTALEVPGDWRTKDAKARLEEASERGLIPLHSKDFQAVAGMVASIRANRLASALFDGGQPEVSMFWQDQRTGISRKGRLDMLAQPRKSGRRIIPDLKTAASAEPVEWAKSAANLGYGMQAAAYEDAVKILGIDDEPQVLFVVVETRAPYLVSVIELDETAMDIARNLNNRACAIYAECTETGVWSGYGDQVHLATMPAWYIQRWEGITH
jgi:hypothetical protein